MSPLPSSPLVLTLTLDASTHSFLTSLRTKYFPAHRNHLHAHLTLFHAIPPGRLPELDSQLNFFCQRPGFNVSVGQPKKMGNRGVMIAVESIKPKSAIEGMHRALLAGMKKSQDAEDRSEEKLSNQDLMKLAHPHVTVLNKAETEQEVEQCLRDLEKMFGDMEGKVKHGRAVGFELWEYMGGPWKPFRQYSFEGENSE